MASFSIYCRLENMPYIRIIIAYGQEVDGMIVIYINLQLSYTEFGIFSFWTKVIPPFVSICDSLMSNSMSSQPYLQSRLKFVYEKKT